MKKSVYIIKNKVTGKAYVGSSISPSYRIESHFSSLRSSLHKVEDMQKDFDKYGEDSFESKVIFTSTNPNMEYFLMKVLKTQNRDFGYNYKDSGGNSKYAIASKWRINPFYWTPLGRASLHDKDPTLYESITWDEVSPKKNDIPNSMAKGFSDG